MSETISKPDALSSAAGFIRPSGAMADLVRGFDWNETALGPMEGWSESLLCSVNLMLACSFPSLIFWGEEMVQLYNDAFAPLLTDRHPGGLGQPAKDFWAEAWHIIAPRLEAVMYQGEAIHQEAALVPILRQGRLQDVWWNYNYSPIYEADGQIAGILVVCQDITSEVVALENLRRSEARVERVLDSIGDAVIVTDTETRVTGMNPVAEQLTGWKESDAQGKELSAVFHIVNEKTRLPVESPAEKVKRIGSVAGLANHTILIGKDGRATAIDDSGAPILDDEGNLNGTVLVFRNIEERRAAEREQEKLAEELCQIMEATSDAIVTVDRNWVISYLNPTAQARYAADREVLGKVLWEEFPNAVYEGSPYVYHFYRAMDEGIPATFEEYFPEPLNMWLRIEVYPARDGIVTLSRNTTEDHAAQEALRLKSEEAERQREEIESVYRTAPIGLALFETKDFRYLRLNDRQAAFFGLKPEQIVGRTLTEMAPIEGLKELFDQVLAGTPVINYPLEGRLVTSPDEYRYWTVSYFPVYGSDGSVRAITAASLEVTQQKKAEKALIQSEKLAVVGRLAASIAHEINNPLEAVTNLIFLAQATDEAETQKDFLRLADRELRRVSAISNQTLRFYRQSTSPQEVSSADLFDSVVSLYMGRIANSEIRIEERKRSEKSVRCFEGEIRQVLSNLVSNAIDAMASGGGRLLLRNREGRHPRTGQSGVVLTIADTGSGMPEAVKKRIFEPFFTTKDIGGTGLGLWVSCEIVDRHGGSLRVRSSQRPGKSGSVFSVFLPFDAPLQRNDARLGA